MRTSDPDESPEALSGLASAFIYAQTRTLLAPTLEDHHARMHLHDFGGHVG